MNTIKFLLYVIIVHMKYIYIYLHVCNFLWKTIKIGTVDNEMKLQKNKHFYFKLQK